MVKELNFDDNVILKKISDVQSITTDEGIIISGGNAQDEVIYYLDNQVSCAIWNLINGQNNLKKIKDNLLSKYETSESELEKDLKKFIKELYLKKLIIIHSSI